VLEAGEDHNDLRVKTPSRFSECLVNSGLDWQFVSEPQKGLNGRQVSHLRGKLSGESSAINCHAILILNLPQAYTQVGLASIGKLHQQNLARLNIASNLGIGMEVPFEKLTAAVLDIKTVNL
jgi:hypothetical protein